MPLCVLIMSTPSVTTASFFFFSSRRRHTRSLCDWSSDVCSSDLDARQPNVGPAHSLRGAAQADRRYASCFVPDGKHLGGIDEEARANGRCADGVADRKSVV